MGRSSPAKSAVRRDSVSKVARQRLSVLELAKELGNVAEACRRRGMDRTSFYEWKQRFQTQGFEGLKDLQVDSGAKFNAVMEADVDLFAKLAEDVAKRRARSVFER